MKKIIYLSITVFMVGCFSASKVKTAPEEVGPTQADVDRVQDKYPGYTLAELHNGKKLYEKKCSTCHGVKKPNKHTPDEWGSVVQKMAAMSNKRSMPIDETTEEAITKYLVTMCTVPEKKG